MICSAGIYVFLPKSTKRIEEAMVWLGLQLFG